MNLPDLTKTSFQQLQHEEQDAAFALSCYDLGDWEEGFDWLSNPEEVRQDIDGYLQDLLPDSLWDSIRWNVDKREKAEDFFLTGDASNYFLAWYLESEFDTVKAKTESKTNKPEFDVLLLESDVKAVGIEMKRVANSGQLTNYLTSFPEDCESRDSVPYTLLIIYYPVSQEVATRAPSLVRGYGPLSAMTNDFYSQDTVFVANIPAPYPRDSYDISPLMETCNVLRERTNLVT